MKTIKLRDPEQMTQITKRPSMPLVLTKGLWLSLLRPSIDSAKDISFAKFSSCHNNIKLDSEKIKLFRKICNQPQNPDTVPMVYLQSLFIGMLGKYIISPFFPLVPMGLIHTKQKIIQKKAIKTDATLDAHIKLSEILNDEKGYEITFLLELTSQNIVVWEGVSTFLSKDKKYKKKKKSFGHTDMLTPFLEIDIPSDIGRQYAKVSGDCNPHHLSNIFAKLFGFKRTIAHGMWSLARSVAEIENQFNDKEILSVDAAFKLPIFIPGKASLGADKTNKDIAFELRDSSTKKPHLAGIIKTR